MEYQVFHRDLTVKLGHIEGTPLLETNNLAEACSFVYNAWREEGKAMYGHEGLKEWKSYFSEVRKGGCDRFGNGYKTLWRFNTVKYGFILNLIRALGHDIRDLPKPGFPPDAMLARLKAIEERRKAKGSAR